MGNEGNGSILCIGRNLITLNLRCSLLKEYGWTVMSSASGHEGVIFASRERVEASVLDLKDGGTEAALIASELKRLHPGAPVIMVVETKENLPPGATLQADALVLQSEEASRLVGVLKSVLHTP